MYNYKIIQQNLHLTVTSGLGINEDIPIEKLPDNQLVRLTKACAGDKVIREGSSFYIFVPQVSRWWNGHWFDIPYHGQKGFFESKIKFIFKWREEITQSLASTLKR